MELQLRNRQVSSGGPSYTTVRPSSFAQQGTVDWPSLADASINASVSFLTRLSGCGVELWTAAVAQVIFGNLKVSVEGERRIQHALSKLHSFGSFGNVMHFGFGVKHIVRTFADSAEGVATIALCAALTEVHSTSVSVEILQEFATLYNPGDGGNLMPSFRQWDALLASCSGVLSASPFGSIVEFFLGLESGELSPLSGHPKEIAKAFEGLAKLSTGLMKSMVLEGHTECGFLAAFAYWILGLRVTVKNAAKETVFPTSGSDSEDWQLMVIFSAAAEDSHALVRRANVYYIDNIVEIFSHIDKSHYYLSGRVDWEAAIGQTFGAAARKLLAVPKILGEVIGSAAKIYAAYPASLDPDSYQYVRKKGRLGPDSSGRAFIDLALKSLPELGGSQSTMRAAMELSYEDAILHYEKAIIMLKEICNCRKHCSATLSSVKDGENDHDRESNMSSDSNIPTLVEHFRWDDKCFCLPLLAVTIIQLVRQLSTLGKIPPGLSPKRKGIQGIYEAAESAFDVQVQRSNGVSGTFGHLLEFMNDKDLLLLAALVFTAFDDVADGIDLGSDGISVRAISGLCFVLDSVLEISDNAENMLRVHIIPGHIEFKGRPYTLVRDGTVTPPLSILEPLVLPTSTARYTTQMERLNSLTARAVVTEASDCLRMTYEIKTRSGTCFFAPKDLVINMTMAASTISCSGKQCRPFVGLSEHFLYTLSGMRLPYLDDWMGRRIPDDRPEKPNICLLGNNAVACCVSLNRFERSIIILQGDECIACCARRALMLEDSNRVVIVSQLTVEKLQRLLGNTHSLIT